MTNRIISDKGVHPVVDPKFMYVGRRVVWQGADAPERDISPSPIPTLLSLHACVSVHPPKGKKWGDV